MSVVASKREKGDLRVETAACALQKYIFTLCGNEKKFMRTEGVNYCWLGNRMLDASTDILCNVRLADKAQRGDGDRELFGRCALQGTEKLFAYAQTAYEYGVLKSSQIKYLSGLIQTVKDLLNAWRKSDKEILKKNN